MSFLPGSAGRVPTSASSAVRSAAGMRRRGLLSTLAVAVLMATGLVATGVVAAGSATAAPTRAHGSAARPAAPKVVGAPRLGPNVYVFTPDMAQADIQRTLDAIATLQVPNQFGTARYALFFEPGTYGSVADPLVFQVGYYTQVAGLGAKPTDVTINGSVDVYNQCDATDQCLALNNFWRSLSNLTIAVTGQSGCRGNTEFWAVSQAAPMRRVNITGGNTTLMDYCTAGPQYASGGFIADSSFAGGTVINGSQQQFFVRNSVLDGWSNGVWNQVFAGDVGAPAQSFGSAADAAPYTTLATTPVSQEEPFLYVGAHGRFRVFVPAVRRNSTGTSWASGTEAGRSMPLSRFLIATPATPVTTINRALARGRNLILTPGVYQLPRPIMVSRPNTVVLGLGFATLVPQNGTVAMQVRTPRGVKLSGMIFDAGLRNSPALLELGTRAGRNATAAAPTLVQDVFFRIGGATAGRATVSLLDHSSNAVLDDVWAWRADHGAGVGWTKNRAAHGVVIRGDHVTAYGLFVEHYQKTEVVWTGQHGTVVFFQNEMPYDVPSQAAWMASPTVKGYPALAIGAGVRTFRGYGMGSYSFFNQGLDIHATEAFAAPVRPGVALHDLLTVFLNGSGGIDSIIDGRGSAANSSNAGKAQQLVSFP